MKGETVGKILTTVIILIFVWFCFYTIYVGEYYSGKWHLERSCVKCDGIITSVYDNGICPYCGNQGSSKVFIETKERIVRYSILNLLQRECLNAE